MLRRTISNSDDIIDSRDVIVRIAELESERDALTDALMDADKAHNADPGNDDLLATFQDADAAIIEWDEGDDGEELKALRALAAECDCGDWRHGETLIRDSYFETYARDMAEDIGAISRNASWPNTCIDWEQACKELQYDYSLVSYGEVEYWIRSC